MFFEIRASMKTEEFVPEPLRWIYHTGSLCRFTETTDCRLFLIPSRWKNRAVKRHKCRAPAAKETTPVRAQASRIPGPNIG
jgi:hypothetical protein